MAMYEAGTPTDCSADSSAESFTARTPADSTQAGHTPVVNTEVAPEAVSPLASSPDRDNAPGAESKRGESEPKTMAARAYQLEMFQRSLERNVIVAVSRSCARGLLQLITDFRCRWILAVERPKCKIPLVLFPVSDLRNLC